MDGRWKREILEWYPRGCERCGRWADELRRMCGCQMDADCSRQIGMEENWRGLHPAVGGERLKMMMI
jgi:hypothetical protein